MLYPLRFREATAIPIRVGWTWRVAARHWRTAGFAIGTTEWREFCERVYGLNETQRHLEVRKLDSAQRTKYNAAARSSWIASTLRS